MYEDIVLYENMIYDDIVILSEEILVPVDVLIQVYNNLYKEKQL